MSESDLAFKKHGSCILTQLNKFADELAEIENNPDAAIDQIVDNDIEVADSIWAGATMIPNPGKQGRMSLC